MKAIADLKVPYPKADRINSMVKLDPEELGARLGGLEMQGYVKTQSETVMEDSSPPQRHKCCRANQSGEAGFVRTEMVELWQIGRLELLLAFEI
jgi:hypothetical protein